MSLLRPGESIQGFEVRALLGEGGMARVYHATSSTDGRDVALKVLLHERPENTQRALREASVQQQLNHPHIVRVLDVLQIRQAPALVMEYVRGPTLQQWLAGYRPSPEESIQVFRGILAGAIAAHDRGMIHRDLKPSNILLAVTEDGIVPKISDFGLAKDSTPGEFRTRTGVMLGTPGYMAPEQLRDAKRASASADVFALGVLLYELLCGVRPFQNQDLVGVYGDMMAESYSTPEGLGAPAPLAQLIRHALSPDPEDRPVDARAMRPGLDPNSTFLEPDEGVVYTLGWQFPGAEQAKDLVVNAFGNVDPLRPALRTRIPGTEGPVLGRDQELQAMFEATEAPGVVTLRGPAGIGKTTLLREFCMQEGARARRWPGGIWWIPLRNQPDPEAALAAALGVPNPEDIAPALARRPRALLVFDEAELAVAQVQPAITRWTAAADELTILSSSRRSLGVSGERVLAIEPLRPEIAVQLFVMRARIQRSDWDPRPEERTAIRDLVVALDCLPLAIELAAARSRMLGPRDLLARMARRLDLLKRRDVEDHRAASLRGAIQDSWDLLTPEEQEAVKWLSVVTADVAPSAADELLLSIDPDPLATLESLADASWLSARNARDGVRYRMLASLREFAREVCEQPQPIWSIHRDVWLARGRRAYEDFMATGDIEASALLAEEVEDLRAIHERFPDSEEGREAGLIASRWLWERGVRRRAESLTRAVVARIPKDSKLYAEAHILKAEVLAKTEPAESRQAAETAAECAQDDRTWARAQIALSQTEDTEAGVRADLDGAIAVAQAISDPLTEANARLRLGGRLVNQGRYVLAENTVEEARALFEQLQHHPRHAKTLSLLGVARILDQRHSQAEEPLRAAINSARAVGDRRAQADALGRLAMILAKEGRGDEARSSLEAALAICREIGNTTGEGYCLCNLGAIEARPERAARLFRRAAVLARQNGHTNLLLLAQQNVGVSELLRGQSELAHPSLYECYHTLSPSHQARRARIGFWLALASAATGRPYADLLEGDFSGEDAQIRDVVKNGLQLLAEGKAEDHMSLKASAPIEEKASWDVHLTHQLVRAVLTHAPLGHSPDEPEAS